MKQLIERLKQKPRHGATAPNTGGGTIGGGGGTSGPSVPQLTNDQIEQLIQTGIQNYIQQQQQQQQTATNGRTFTQFDLSNDVVTKQKETITAGVWSDNQGSLTTHYTSSYQTISQRRYYADVYQNVPTTEGSAVQYSVAYGHALGSGSSQLGTEENPASLAVYAQYRQLLLESDSSRFVTAGSGSTDSIYVLNVKRNRMKERLDEGNFELPLLQVSARDTNATGSVTVTGTQITLIDDSSITSPTLGRAGRVYNIVSGSLDNGVYNESAPDYYGLFWPDYGVMVLDGKMLDQQLTFDTNVTIDDEGNNHFALYHSISGSSTGFIARNSEKITSSHYFVRIKNGEYNFSNNASFITGSVGLIRNSDFIGDPKTYITTIGLYNSRQELLAIAKLSQPVLKSFSREQLIRIKLDY